jgi:hypothetical protein
LRIIFATATVFVLTLKSGSSGWTENVRVQNFMIQLTQTVLRTEPGDIPRLAEEFAETGCALLPGFLEPRILRPLLQWIQSARFEERNEVDAERGVFGTTLLVPETERALFLLHFILNRPDLFEAVQQVTGCPKISNFIGRLHRTRAETGQHIDWHRDVVDTRTLGLCINLSAEDYTGGVLQLRDADRIIRAEVGRAAPGDAFLFRIDRDWQHRLTTVESGLRTVGVGWFRTAPEWSVYALNAVRSRQILNMARITGRTISNGKENTGL